MSRLAIDLRILEHARTGFFRYAQGGLQSLADHPPEDEIVLLGSHGQDLGHLNAGGWEQVATAAPLFATEERQRLEETVRAHAIDVVHFPFSLFPGRVASRVALTIHDLTVLRHPETIAPRYRPFYRAAIDRAPDADLLLVDSDTVRRELMERVDVDPTVVHPHTPFEEYGLARCGSTHRPGPPSDPPYVLAVGSLEPRKDPLRLLAAWEAGRARARTPARLVIAASHGWLEEEFHTACERSPLRDEVEVRRDVDDAALAQLLTECSVMLALSRYEGFGLPVLEAARAGACVLSTPTPSLVEGGVDPALLIAPDEGPERVGERLATLIDDPERRRVHATRVRERLEAYYRELPPRRLASAYSRLTGTAP